MNRTRKEKIEYLAGRFPALWSEERRMDLAKQILDELFPPLPPVESDDSYQRHYIPIPAGYEIQTKGTGSTFRIAGKEDRMPISVSSFEREFLTKMAHDIREEYGE